MSYEIGLIVLWVILGLIVLMLVCVVCCCPPGPEHPLPPPIFRDRAEGEPQVENMRAEGEPAGDNLV